MTRTLTDLCNHKSCEICNIVSSVPPPPPVPRRTNTSVPRRQPVTGPDRGLGLQKL